MSKKKIIYFVTNGFSERDFVRYGLEEFFKRGYCVEVWNFSNFMFKYFSFPEPYVSSDFILKNIDTIKTFNILINLESRDIFVINLLFFNVKTYPIYKKLKVNGILFCETSLGGMPLCYNSLRKINLNFFKVYNFFFKKIVRFLNIDIKPTFLIVAGAKVAKSFNHQKLLHAHSRDYDLFLKSKDKLSNTSPKDIIVFLDVNLVEHSDFELLNIKNKVTKENYYRSLKKYFFNLKKSTGKDVVVAAHPRSNISELKNSFKGFKIIQNDTLKLVYQSSFVVSHDTTAISFIVLLNKPIQFITTDELVNSGDKNTECMADYFDKKVINIDKEFYFDEVEFYKIPYDKYKKYVEEYIKIKNSKKKLLWDICIDEIEKKGNE